MTEPEDTGLFGKLPRSRPGTRSPRRAGGEAKAEPTPASAAPKPRSTPRTKATAAPRTKATAAPGAKGDAAPRPRAAASPRPRPAPRPHSDTSPKSKPRPVADEGPDEADERGAGLEELAWAGIAVTAEAATLGVRLMSRALDAARRATERG